MRNIIAVIAIAVLVMLVLTTQPQLFQPTGKLSADGVDTIPNISQSECLQQIRVTNPEMSDQDANDNCLAIEAVNKNNKELCDEIVNSDIKQACLAQF